MVIKCFYYRVTVDEQVDLFGICYVHLHYKIAISVGLSYSYSKFNYLVAVFFFSL